MYTCKNCSYRSSNKLGMCPQCGSWGTFNFIEQSKVEIKAGKKMVKKNYDQVDIGIHKLSDVSLPDQYTYSSGMKEIDEVLGGGIVLGSLVLLGGEPGIGKTTLLLQILSNISKDKNVLYVSAEESVSQLKSKSKHLDIYIDNLYVLNEDSLEKIFVAIEKITPSVVVIDSIQTIFSENTEGFIGSISQIKMCTALILEKAKKHNITFFIVAHITKDGDIAGPKNLEHMVDVVLYFEGDRSSSLRMLRCIKNRFGSSGEISMMKMTSRGLFPVDDYAFYFLSNIDGELGRILYPHIEGNKVMFVEVQALVSYTVFGYPKRTVNGIDLNRLNMLLSVIEKYLGIKTPAFDIYINVVGNLNIKDRDIDLAVCMSIYIAVKKIQLNKNIIAFGELNLNGEILKSNTDIRIKHIKKITFPTDVISANDLIPHIKSTHNLIKINNVKDFLKILS